MMSKKTINKKEKLSSALRENIKLRKKAKEKGWKLSQHGLFEESVNLAKNKSEKEIFEFVLQLKLQE